ncbi:DEAD/DEAH box helicase [Microbispora sp. NBC_01189]|uniref:DEAD/DEAH box helicase n=1 Tax=Microbispora sp. NBC_01189 TaxID=2903583 RepID=UPI002E0F1E52|nr:DEAD/DEAH box helicase [Microbispora sp. NBC_01189]
MALPLALAGQDVIGQARTGTGKTYAFGVAMLQLVGKPRKNRKKPRGLVLVPTRELALQVTEDLVLAAGKLGSRILTVYGGRAYEPQIEALKNGVDVIVGTPGRLLDLVKQKHLDLSQITMLVLDEADRMLDLGFLPDIERIIKLVPDDRQTMLFSATMPGEIVNLSRRYLDRPTRVRAETTTAEAETTTLTTQHVYRTHRMDKIEILGRLLQSRGSGLTMVFCETKRACDMVAEQLKDKGFAVAAVHGDLGQGQREQALRAFRNGKINVLVATDVAARGIDIDDVTHVVNYDCPQDEKAYVHRIGRTGRAGRTGVAVTFVEWTELTRWKVINNALSLDFADPVETYSSSPHLYGELDIPEGTRSVLPRAQRSRTGLESEEIEDLGETGRTRSHGRSDRGGRGRESDRDRDRDNTEERRERPARTRERRRTRGGRLHEAEGSSGGDAGALTSQATAQVGDGSGSPEQAAQPAQGAQVQAQGRRSRRGGANTDALTGALAEVPAARPQEEQAAGAASEPEAAPRRASRRRTRAADTAGSQIAEPRIGEAQVGEAQVAEPRSGDQAVAAPVTEPIAEPAADPVADRPTRRRTRSTDAGASDEAPSTLSVSSVPSVPSVSSVPSVPSVPPAEATVNGVADEPVRPPVARQEPERIVPASPFMVVFRSPDLATDDDDPAPSAATERAQQRRRPPRPRPRRTG